MMKHKSLMLVLFLVCGYGRPAFGLRSAQAQVVDLLTNGDFEQGFEGWESGPAFSIQSQIVQSGETAAKLEGNASLVQGWFDLAAGDYKLTGWMRLDVMEEGPYWGGIRSAVETEDGTEVAHSGFFRPSRVALGEWFKVAIEFQLTEPDRVRVLVGSQSNRTFVAYFDDFRFFLDEPGNLSPVIFQLNGTPTSGQVPLTVSFSALADDPDGIPYLTWDFGDGGYATEEQATHTYISRGDYPVTLNVYDDEDGLTSQTVIIQVTDADGPQVVITSPEAGPTDAAVVVVEGTADDNGQVDTLYWDNPVHPGGRHHLDKCW